MAQEVIADTFKDPFDPSEPLKCFIFNRVAQEWGFLVPLKSNGLRTNCKTLGGTEK